MNVTIRDNVNRVEGREVILVDVSNADAVRMRIRGRGDQEAFMRDLACLMFPNTVRTEIVYRYGKRGVSNSGFKGAIWAFKA